MILLHIARQPAPRNSLLSNTYKLYAAKASSRCIAPKQQSVRWAHHSSQLENIRNIGIIAHVDAVSILVIQQIFSVTDGCPGKNDNNGAHAIL